MDKKRIEEGREGKRREERRGETTYLSLQLLA